MSKKHMSLYKVAFPGWATYYVKADGPIIALNGAWVKLGQEYSEVGEDLFWEVKSATITLLAAEKDVL